MSSFEAAQANPTCFASSHKRYRFTAGPVVQQAAGAVIQRTTQDTRSPATAERLWLSSRETQLHRPQRLAEVDGNERVRRNDFPAFGFAA